MPDSVFDDLRAQIQTYEEIETKREAHKGKSSICMKRKESQSKPKPFVAYDLETTRIKSGTPKPLYITAFSDGMFLSMPITGRDKYQNLCDILETHFLIRDRNNTRYIAWNGNNFDVYFIAKALLKSDRWTLRPYLTRSKSVRGLKITETAKPKDGEKKLQFEFLDGIAMTGMLGTSLKKFLSLFAPEYKKLELDFSKEEFDCKNPAHVLYAERDSEGLYYAMVKVNAIVKELTGNELQPTVGNLAIRYFQSKIPHGVTCWHPPESVKEPLYNQLKRGGYCWVQRQFIGRVWKYDINQAYAAAMRDAALPSGRCVSTDNYEPGKSGVYRAVISRKVLSKVPFYFRTVAHNRGYFTSGAEVETWITSSEYEHLLRDGWDIKIMEGSFWEESFNMAEMVNELERLRFTDPQGPSGPLGTMVKYIGNNAYGKTLEQLEGLELIFANSCPENFIEYMPEIPEMAHVFARMSEPLRRAYHQPQIGVFTTAHVRIVIREAALKEPDAFLYADTDGLIFSKAVTHLDIDPRRYGAWKVEVTDRDHMIIGKKIYADLDGLDSNDEETRNKSKKAKGLIVKDLTREQFDLWMQGKPPEQEQIQKQNFVKFIGGREMFAPHPRSGTDVSVTQQCKLVAGEFVPILPDFDAPSVVQ